MKKIILFMLLLATLTTPFVSAISPDYEIKEVYVNGIEVTASNLVQVEVGTTAIVTVLIEGTGNVDNTRIRAWMGGYDYGDVEVVSDIFDIQNGVMYKKTLYLEIPEDLDTTSNKYTLHIEAFDSKNSEGKDYSLFFEKERHKVVVKDVLFSPITIAPGENVGVKVRLENQGKNVEKDIEVTVFIEELGLSQRVYLDELDIDDQAETRTVMLTIPSTAREKTYKMSILVEYDKGHAQTEDFALLDVNGDSLQYDEEAVVSMSTITELTVGQEETYKIQITNFESTSKEFTININGIDAEYESTVLVAGGATSEVYFTVNPTDAGVHNIFISVSSEDGIVAEKQYSVNIEEKANTLPYTLAGILIVLVVISGMILLRRSQ